jgi:hypothetical protein
MQADSNTACEACGLIFRKYQEANPPAEPLPQRDPIVSNTIDGKRAVFALKPFHFFLGAALSAFFSAYCLWDSFSFTQSQKLQGQVVDWTSHTVHGRDGTAFTYSPQVQITLPDGGKKITEGPPTRLTWFLPSKGERVEVYYKPDALFYDIRINYFFSLWLWPWVWGLIAGLLILFGFLAKFKVVGLGNMTVTANSKEL